MSDTKPYVALVDDEAPVRVALVRLLRLEDCEVVAFPSGEAFLGSLVARIPGCVILDVNMPRLSGFDVQARMLAEHIDVPAVFITASNDPTLDQAALEAGGVRLLRKPFSNDELIAAVRAALRRKSRNAS